MNTPPKEYVLVDEQRELEFITACFSHAGASSEQAAFVARMLVNSDLRGVRTHGIWWAEHYYSQFNDGMINPDPNIAVIHDTPTSVLLDGDGALGYMPCMRGTELAIAKAKEVGIGMGMVRHIGHNGAVGNYTRRCAAEGCVGFAVQGDRREPHVSKDGSKRSIANPGLPPMSFAIPAGEADAIVLDMVAHVMSGLTEEQKEVLPGQLPGPYFKSLGLVATAVLLGGALPGSALPVADVEAHRWSGATLGGMVLVIDVATVAPDGRFGGDVDTYINNIHEHFTPLPGYDEVLLPGEIEEKTMALHRRDGIRFGEREQSVAQKLHEATGIALPWE